MTPRDEKAVSEAWWREEEPPGRQWQGRKEENSLPILTDASLSVTFNRRGGVAWRVRRGGGGVAVAAWLGRRKMAERK